MKTLTKTKIIQQILQQHAQHQPGESGQAFAPSNIALCKYWGKRDTELNLPVTSSLSISLADKGAFTRIYLNDEDQIYLNGNRVAPTHDFSKRAVAFLDLFRTDKKIHFQVETEMNIPVAAGLASSACGLAALVLALNDLLGWQLAPRYLSIFARIGSGSAARSLWHGFVEWHGGHDEDGLDSFAAPLPTLWPDLRIGLHILSIQQKPISSREAMQRTVKTSTLYQAWPQQVTRDMPALKQAISELDFTSLGTIAENNALSMHATMMSTWPPVVYSTPETIAAMKQVWALREQGIEVYFTQDAGPNLKLLFLAEQQPHIMAAFPNLTVIAPFKDSEGSNRKR